MAISLQNVHGSEFYSPGQHFDIPGAGLRTGDTTVHKAGEACALIRGGSRCTSNKQVNTLAAVVNNPDGLGGKKKLLGKT